MKSRAPRVVSTDRYTLTEVAALLGCCRDTVRATSRKYGITPRRNTSRRTIYTGAQVLTLYNVLL